MEFSNTDFTLIKYLVLLSQLTWIALNKLKSVPLTICLLRSALKVQWVAFTACWPGGVVMCSRSPGSWEHLCMSSRPTCLSTSHSVSPLLFWRVKQQHHHLSLIYVQLSIPSWKITTRWKFDFLCIFKMNMKLCLYLDVTQQGEKCVFQVMWYWVYEVLNNTFCHQVSQLTCVPTLVARPSHSACSTIGRSSLETHWMPHPSPV